MRGRTPELANLERKAIEELKEFWITALYLGVFLSAFTFYRRMVLAEFGVTYLHYGAAFIEALVIAKIVLVGRALGLDKQLDRGIVIGCEVLDDIHARVRHVADPDHCR